MHPTVEHDDTAPTMEMPRYISHKRVWALEIKYINRETLGKVVLSFVDAGYAPITFEENDPIFARYKPIQRDFYVVYADGYRSFSPRKAFLEGYRAAAQMLSISHWGLFRYEILPEDVYLRMATPDLWLRIEFWAV